MRPSPSPLEPLLEVWRTFGGTKVSKHQLKKQTRNPKNKRRRCRNRTPLSYAMCFHIDAMASSEEQGKRKLLFN